MPDKYGRIGYNDFMGIANTVNSINKTRQGNQRFAQEQQDRAENRALLDDTRQNYYLTKEGGRPSAYGDPGVYEAPGEMQDPQLIGSPESRILGKQMVAEEETADRLLRKQNENKDVNEQENKLWQQFTSLPNQQQKDQFIDSYTPKSKADYEAFLSFGKKIEQNSEFKMARTNRNIEKGKKRFEIWNTMLKAGIGFVEEGNIEFGEKYLEFAVNQSHHPLELQKNINGTYDLIYEELGQGKRIVGNDVSLEQAYNEALSITPEIFIEDYVAQKQMIAQKNQNAEFVTWSNGKDGYDVTTLYTQSNPKNGVAVIYEKGGDIATKRDGSQLTIDDLKSGGFRPRDIDTENKIKQGEATDALTANRNKSTSLMGRSDEVSPNSYKYKLARTKYVQASVKDLFDSTPDELEKAKAKASTEFDADQGDWKKISNPKTKQKGYLKPNGDIVDDLGRPVEKARPKPKQAPKRDTKQKQETKQSEDGKREDGTKKGPGFLGEIKNTDGSVSTEVSVGIEIGGKETEIPLLVPTLTKEEIKIIQSGGEIPQAIIDKAVDHAKKRIAEGKSPFAENEEEPPAETRNRSLLKDFAKRNTQTMLKQPEPDVKQFKFRKRPSN